MCVQGVEARWAAVCTAVDELTSRPERQHVPPLLLLLVLLLVVLLVVV